MRERAVQNLGCDAWLAAMLWLAACGSPASPGSEASPSAMIPAPSQTNTAGGPAVAPPDPGTAAGVSGGALPDAPSGQAGSTGAGAGSGVAGAGASGTGAVSDPEVPAGAPAYPDLRGTCPGLDSGFPGDDACIAPPAPDEGFQIHVGPADHGDPTQVNVFVLGGGQESSGCWSYHTPNAQPVYYQGYTFSGRPGTHHIFNSMLNVEVTDGGDIHVCMDAGLGNAPTRLGSLPAAGKPYTARVPAAPENTGVGQLIPARVPAEADMHYFNATDAPLLREFWLNIYYIDEADVTEQGKELRGMGGIGWAVLPIPAGADEIYRYECAIDAGGRILAMAGHYHAHGKRQTVTVRRANGQRQPIFDMFDYTNAVVYQFDSVTQNVPRSGTMDGAISGRLDVFAGDVLEWECHIVNDGQAPLTYSNDVQTGEMCNVFGLVVGPDINCLLP